MYVTKAQIFFIYKLANENVICKDKNLIFVTFEVVLPNIKSFKSN